MLTRYLFIGFVLFISCNQPITSKSQKKPDSIATITSKIDTETIQEPDVAYLRKRLFDFFERHKNENVFDTTDGTYADYWGYANYSTYHVNAGYLFNKNQVHCIILFSDDVSTKMHIYYKKNNNWIKIYEDTGLYEHANIELIDWNRDGTKDISYESTRTWSYNYELWLVDKSGKKLYYVSKFTDVLNPEYDSITGYINSSYSHVGNGDYQRYKFSNYKLKNVDGLTISDDYTAKTDPHITVTYERNGKTYKRIKTGYADLMKYIPDRWKEDVKPFFGQ